MAYNLTAMENATTLIDLIIGINDMGGGLFMASFLLIIFVITFIMLKRDDNISALLYASYLTSVSGVFLTLIGLIGIRIMVIPLVLTAIFMFIKVINKD